MNAKRDGQETEACLNYTISIAVLASEADVERSATKVSSQGTLIPDIRTTYYVYISTYMSISFDDKRILFVVVERTVFDGSLAKWLIQCAVAFWLLQTVHRCFRAKFSKLVHMVIIKFDQQLPVQHGRRTQLAHQVQIVVVKFGIRVDHHDFAEKSIGGWQEMVRPHMFQVPIE